MTQTSSVVQIEKTLETVAALRAGGTPALDAAADLLIGQMNELLLAAGREFALSSGWVSVRRSLPPLSNSERQWPVLILADSQPEARVAHFYGRVGYRLQSGEWLAFADVKLWRASPKDSEIGIRLVDEMHMTVQTARDHDLLRYDDTPTAFAMRAIAEDAWNKALAALGT